MSQETKICIRIETEGKVSVDCPQPPPTDPCHESPAHPDVWPPHDAPHPWPSADSPCPYPGVWFQRHPHPGVVLQIKSYPGSGDGYQAFRFDDRHDRFECTGAYTNRKAAFKSLGG
jgi:hypothetical protein